MEPVQDDGLQRAVLTHAGRATPLVAPKPSTSRIRSDLEHVVGGRALEQAVRGGEGRPHVVELLLLDVVALLAHVLRERWSDPLAAWA